MREQRKNFLVGLALILGGALFLLMNLSIIPSDLPLIWGGILGLAGLGFWFYYLTQRGHWWPVIPGMSLLGISMLILLESFFSVPEGWGGALFLAAVGVAFWIIYLVTGSREWWAIIPGGALFALAATAVFSPLLREDADGALFMLGMALTFALVYLLPAPGARKRWALIPAGVLAVIGLALAASMVNLLRYLWPVALILVGFYAIFRSLRPGEHE